MGREVFSISCVFFLAVRRKREEDREGGGGREEIRSERKEDIGQGCWALPQGLSPVQIWLKGGRGLTSSGLVVLYFLLLFGPQSALALPPPKGGTVSATPTSGPLLSTVLSRLLLFSFPLIYSGPAGGQHDE